MNILLTGGAGYIGSHTAVALSEAGHEVIILDNFFNSEKNVLNRLNTILGKSLSFIEADVRDTDAVIKALKEYRIDTVIHFAGLKAVGESSKNPIEYYENNIQGSISLLKAMKSTDIKNLIFSSSATVYGCPQYLPIDENHPTSATNPYGRSKLHAEEILKDVSASDGEWRIICLRYFNPVGAHPLGLIGENPIGIPNNLMPFIGEVAAGKLSQLNIFGNDYSTPDGTGVRDYIHVMDLADGHLAAVNYLNRFFGCVPINLGAGQGYSVLQMIAAFEAVSGKKIPYHFVARRPGDIASCYAKADKASKLLGWQVKRNLEDMCISAWRWQQLREA